DSRCLNPQRVAAEDPVGRTIRNGVPCGTGGQSANRGAPLKQVAIERGESVALRGIAIDQCAVWIRHFGLLDLDAELPGLDRGELLETPRLLVSLRLRPRRGEGDRGRRRPGLAGL